MNSEKQKEKDHMTPEEARLMEEKQEYILEQLGIPRE